MAFERGQTGVIVPFPRELADTLPVTLDATGLAVLVFDGDRWDQLALLPFMSSR